MLRKTARTALMAALAAGSVGGCTYLPAAGPTASAIQEGSEVATADGGLLARYEIIDVNPAVVEALRGRPLDSLLASFGDHRPSAEPVIGIGDMVSVSIWEAGSGGLFSGPLVADRFSAGSKSALIPEQPVGRDGAISVPYAGRIKVDGRRPQDVQTLIESALAGKAIQPQVLVSVTRPISQAVTITGEGAAGARLPLSGHGDRILDVIAAAGGNRSPVSETFVRLSRGPVTATVPLTTVVSNPKENIYLRPNDVLTLVRDPQTFIAVGALGNRPPSCRSRPTGSRWRRRWPRRAAYRTSPPIRPGPSSSGSSRPAWCGVSTRARSCSAHRWFRWCTGSTCATPTACSCPRRSGCATATSSTCRTRRSPSCRRC